MYRPGLLALLAAGSTAAGCSAIAAIAGAPSIVSVTVTAPPGVLVGETAQATSMALGDDGKEHPGRPVTWRSSDPTALSIDSQGLMRGLIAGRTVTITAEVEGKTGSAPVAVASDDSRFGFALADQPDVPGPYAPAAATSYNSGGGTIDITRASVGTYTVRFAGLGRTPGQRDNVHVSGYNATATLCKPDLWDATPPDLRVTVGCNAPNGTPKDSRFTVLVLGAWAFGRTAPIAFVVTPGDTTSAVFLDTAATSRNSTGGHVGVGRVAEGEFAVQFKGIGPFWTGHPVAIEVTALGLGPRRCRLIAVDPSMEGFGIWCTKPGGAPGDASFSLLWLPAGRPSKRFGFAWAQNPVATADYTPDPAWLINSSGGSVKARRLTAGVYHVVFQGLGRPPGATETVMVQPFLDPDFICDVVQWGNTGVNDLFVDVACFDPSAAPANIPVSVMVVE